MEHTKGEWKIEKRDGHSMYGVRPVICTRDVDRIAVISYRGGASRDEADANALLIAAAPDLLVACEALVSGINNPNPDATDEVSIAMDKAVVTIKKARK